MATVSIEKLDMNIPRLKSEKDWQVWKFQEMHALKALGLRDRDHRRGQRQSEAEGFLLNSAVHWHVPVVMSCESLKQIWDTLCQFFERKTVSNKVFMLMQLYGLRMKKEAQISDHLHKLDELADLLAAIGENHKFAVLL